MGVLVTHQAKCPELALLQALRRILTTLIKESSLQVISQSDFASKVKHGSLCPNLGRRKTNTPVFPFSSFRTSHFLTSISLYVLIHLSEFPPIDF